MKKEHFGFKTTLHILLSIFDFLFFAVFLSLFIEESDPFYLIFVVFMIADFGLRIDSMKRMKADKKFIHSLEAQNEKMRKDQIIWEKRIRAIDEAAKKQEALVKAQESFDMDTEELRSMIQKDAKERNMEKEENES